LQPTSVRILVVDDFEPMRHLIRTVLLVKAHLQVVGEASDGLEAVQKAMELKPDLILLDIGLPLLNGIDAARQIRGVSPDSKIIFVSHETSADVLQKAMSSGAIGYVAKTKVGTDLINAIEAALQGKVFVSDGLAR